MNRGVTLTEGVKDALDKELSRALVSKLTPRRDGKQRGDPVRKVALARLNLGLKDVQPAESGRDEALDEFRLVISR